MRKPIRLLAILLAVLMTASVMPVSAFATETYVAAKGEKRYETLAEAVAAGGEVTLLTDVSGSGIVIDKDVTIDLGGYTYTVDGTPVGSTGTQTLGFQILKDNDVTIKNGKVEVATDAVKMLIQNYANLTLEDVTVDGTGSANMLYVLSNNSGEVAITGATNITAPEGAVAFDVYDYTAGGYTVPTVKVDTTGTITGAIEVSETATLEVSSGTFTVELDEAWCADTYAGLADMNGNYVVGVAPTATVNNLGTLTVPAGEYTNFGGGANNVDMPLSFVMQFVADQSAAEGSASPYADWYADFVISVTGLENGTFDASGCYLAGHYGSFGWWKIPLDGLTVEDAVRYPVMLSVANAAQQYEYICSGVADFKCAMYLAPEVIAANPNLQVNLELCVIDSSKGPDEAKLAVVEDRVYTVEDQVYVADDFVIETAEPIELSDELVDYRLRCTTEVVDGNLVLTADPAGTSSMKVRLGNLPEGATVEIAENNANATMADGVITVTNPGMKNVEVPMTITSAEGAVTEFVLVADFNNAIRYATYARLSQTGNDLTVTSGAATAYVLFNTLDIDGGYVEVENVSRNLLGRYAISGSAIRFYNPVYDDGSVTVNVKNADGETVETYNVITKFADATEYTPVLNSSLRCAYEVDGDNVTVTADTGVTNVYLNFGRYFAEALSASVNNDLVKKMGARSWRVMKSDEIIEFDLYFDATSYGGELVTRHVVVDFNNKTNDNSGSSATVEVDENGTVKNEVSIDGESVNATVPAGVAVNEGTEKLTLSVSELDETTGNITTGETDVLASYDVHIEGVSSENNVPIIVTLGEILPVGMNEGNVGLYHIENGVTNAMTQVFSLEELDAHNEFYYDPATGVVTVAMATFSEVAVVSDTTKAWEGNVDYTWYDAEKTELTIANADQLVAFSRIVGGMASADNKDFAKDSFVGKTVKLVADINLNDLDSENGKVFYPIGYYNNVNSFDKVPGGTVESNVTSFSGTFDGNGHTIKNFYQNTWEMFGDYNSGYSGTPNHYDDAMGLFGYVNGGTVKNLTVDNFSCDGEFTPAGVIAAYACDATFENIAITNCNPRVYNTGNGGIVGIGGNSNDPDTYKLTFNNITIDNTNKITALWGSWDVACGGLVGMFRGAGHAYMTNCHVAAQIDVFNDVCGNYQYYWYRYAGMMIGTNKNMVTDENGYTVPETSKFHAENCTVHFGDWNNYWYCELVANSLASYTHDHQFSRLTRVDAVDVENKTVTVGGVTTAIPAGRQNYVVVTGKPYSTEFAECYHFVDGEVWSHEDAGTEVVNGETVLKENNAHIYLPFNQLFTGYGWGVKHIPVYNGEDYAFEGITILDREVADSEVKFEAVVAENAEKNNNTTFTVDQFFAVKEGATINNTGVYVTIDKVNEEDSVEGKFTANTEDWTKGTISFTGTGPVKLTIQDYDYCTPTVLNLLIVNAPAVTEVDTSELVMSTVFPYNPGAGDAYWSTYVSQVTEPKFYPTIPATVDGVETDIPVTWVSEDYQSNVVGEYTFTAVPDGYTWECAAPKITVKVVDAGFGTAGLRIYGFAVAKEGDLIPTVLKPGEDNRTEVYDATGCNVISALLINAGNSASNDYNMFAGIAKSWRSGDFVEKTAATNAVGDSSITLEGITYMTRVWGSGYAVPQKGDAYVTVKDTTLLVKKSEVAGIYGGGISITLDGNVFIKVAGTSTIPNIYGGGHGGSVTGNVNIDITGKPTITNIFGGSYSSGTVGGTATVTIHDLVADSQITKIARGTASKLVVNLDDTSSALLSAVTDWQTDANTEVYINGVRKYADTESIELDATELEMLLGDEAVQLTATVAPTNASPVVWSVEGDAVTVVDGLVTAVKVGTATVTATAGAKSASCVVTVTSSTTPITAVDTSQLVTKTKFLYSGNMTEWSGGNRRTSEVTNPTFYNELTVSVNDGEYDALTGFTWTIPDDYDPTAVGEKFTFTAVAPVGYEFDEGVAPEIEVEIIDGTILYNYISATSIVSPHKEPIALVLNGNNVYDATGCNLMGAAGNYMFAPGLLANGYYEGENTTPGLDAEGNPIDGYSTNLTVKGSRSKVTVGGALNTTVYGDTNLILNGATMTGSTYAGGMGRTASAVARVEGDTHVTVVDSTLTNLYGGGYAGNGKNSQDVTVTGNAYIDVSGNVKIDAIYGGGYSDATTYTAPVEGTAYINIHGLTGEWTIGTIAREGAKSGTGASKLVVNLDNSSKSLLADGKITGITTAGKTDENVTVKINGEEFVGMVTMPADFEVPASLEKGTAADILPAVENCTWIYDDAEAGDKVFTLVANDGYFLDGLVKSQMFDVIVTEGTVAADEVVLNETEVAIRVGETVELTAVVLPEETTDKTVVWSASENVELSATEGDEVTVTALAVGEATVTATSGSAVSTCIVTVNPKTQINEVDTSNLVMETKFLYPGEDKAWGTKTLTTYVTDPTFYETITVKENGEWNDVEVVEWVCTNVDGEEVAFDGTAIDATYYFKPVLPAGYEWAEGFEVPAITVEIIDGALVYDVYKSGGVVTAHTEAIPLVYKDAGGIYDATGCNKMGTDNYIFGAGLIVYSTGATKEALTTPAYDTDLTVTGTVTKITAGGGVNLALDGSTYVKVYDATINSAATSAVYGGGIARASGTVATVSGDTHVTVTDSTITSVYGGGYGANNGNQDVTVEGNAYIDVSGLVDIGTIYGSGSCSVDTSIAPVKGTAYVTINDLEDGSTIGEITRNGANYADPASKLVVNLDDSSADLLNVVTDWKTDANIEVYINGVLQVPELEGVELDVTELSFTEGDDAVQLTATIVPANAVATVEWSVEGDAVTVVDGLVTPVKAGNATVTATAGDLSASCTVTVAAKIVYADYSIVTNAEALKPTDFTSYTNASVQAYNEAIAALTVPAEGLTKDQESVYTDYATAVETAVGLLKVKANYTSVNAQVEAAGQVDRSLYTATSLAKLDEALENVNYDLDVDQQATVNGYATAIELAIAGLEMKPADYSAVEEAKGKVEALDRAIYTADSLAEVDAAVAAVVDGLDFTKQTEVDAMAKAINDALGALALKAADYSAVEEAKGKVEALNRALYTADSLAEVDNAVAAVVDGLDITKQAEVDAMAKAINDALGALALKAADYSAVETAKGKVEALDRSLYTATSLAAVDAAVAAVVDGLDITKQADVDAYADAIEDALSKLVLIVYVAEVDGVKYETLADALAVGGNVTLLTDVELTERLTINAGQEIVLDLNGYTISGGYTEAASSAVITNKGKLTVKDSSDAQTGKITSAALNPDLSAIPSYANNTITNSGEFILESGTIECMTDAGAAYAIDVAWHTNDASVTIKGGKVTAVRCAIRVVAWSSAKDTLNIEGGEITGGTRGIWIHLPGSNDAVKDIDVNITGGTISAENGLAVYSYSFGDSYSGVDVAISGEAEFNGDVAFGGGSSYNGSGAEKVTVTGGTFNGGIYTYNTKEHAIAVSGGTFTQAVEETYCADGFVPADNGDGTFGVVEFTPVATANGVEYETLAEAVAVGGEVVLLTDASGDGIVIDKDVTIDLGGFTYTIDGALVGSTGTKTLGFQIIKDNNVTIKNGAIAADVASIEANNEKTLKMLIQNYANLTLEDVTLDMSAVEAMLYVVSNNSGETNITGATNITAPEGAVAFDVYDYTAGGYTVPTVKVDTTGTITGEIEVSETATLAVSGGTYTVALEKAWCADGFIPADNGDGTYGVKVGEYVATANGVEYETLAEAVAVGGEVVLLTDASGDGIVINKDVTIDLGGFTYTIDGALVGSTGTKTLGFQILKDNNVTIKNGAIAADVESIEANNEKTLKMLIQNYANLTLEDVTLDMSAVEAMLYVVSNNSGETNITGATNITAPEGAVAFDVYDYTAGGYTVPTVKVDTTGTITGEIEVSETATLAVSGGTYTVALEKAWCADGFIPADNGDGTYGVKVGEYVATANGVGYETLAEAVAQGGEVVLLADVAGAGVVINNDVTIDFAGYTYTFTEGVGSTGTESNGFQILTGNTVVLKNGTLKVAEESKDKFYTIIQNYADLTVEDMTLDGTNLDKWSTTDGDSYVLSVNSGNVFVTGNTNIIANDEGDKAFAFDSCEKAPYTTPVVTVNTTGKIAGKIESTGGDIAISSGTFTVELDEAWCADTYAGLADMNGNYIVGVKPTATVNNLGAVTVPAGGYTIYGGGDTSVDMPLSFVMQFLADQSAAEGAASPYADWYADFVITVSGLENGSFDATGCYLAGHYGSFGWWKIPLDGMTVEDAVRYPVMLSVANGAQKYDYICSGVADFKCAMYLTPEVIAANPNLEVNLELCVIDNSKGPDEAKLAIVEDRVYKAAEYTYAAEEFLFEADYTAVEEALANVPADLTIYTDTSSAVVQAAVDAVVYGLKSDEQATVDAYAAAINEAVANLVLKVAVELSEDLIDWTLRGDAVVAGGSLILTAETKGSGTSSIKARFGGLPEGATIAFADGANTSKVSLADNMLTVINPGYGKVEVPMVITSADGLKTEFMLVGDFGYAVRYISTGAKVGGWIVQEGESIDVKSGYSTIYLLFDVRDIDGGYIEVESVTRNLVGRYTITDASAGAIRFYNPVFQGGVAVVNVKNAEGTVVGSYTVNVNFGTYDTNGPTDSNGNLIEQWVFKYLEPVESIARATYTIDGDNIIVTANDGVKDSVQINFGRYFAEAMTLGEVDSTIVKKTGARSIIVNKSDEAVTFDVYIDMTMEDDNCDDMAQRHFTVTVNF